MKKYFKPQVIASYNEADLITTDSKTIKAQAAKICYGSYCFTIPV
jgi:hypothetical protein